MNLEDYFHEEVPSDEQFDCIREFFQQKHWDTFDFPNTEQGDLGKIRYAYDNFEQPQHIRRMLLDWLEEGF